MRSTFSSGLPDRPEDSCFATLPSLWTVSTNDSEPYHLVLFLLYVTFAIYVALLQPVSILHTIKQTAFCCSVHISSDTDQLWEVKLAGLGKSDGRPCTQVVSIGQPTKASQRRSLPTINWTYPNFTYSNYRDILTFF
jgi:hypothetical protein